MAGVFRLEEGAAYGKDAWCVGTAHKLVGRDEYGVVAVTRHVNVHVRPTCAGEGFGVVQRYVAKTCIRMTNFSYQHESSVKLGNLVR